MSSIQPALSLSDHLNQITPRSGVMRPSGGVMNAGAVDVRYPSAGVGTIVHSSLLKTLLNGGGDLSTGQG